MGLLQAGDFAGTVHYEVLLCLGAFIIAQCTFLHHRVRTAAAKQEVTRHIFDLACGLRHTDGDFCGAKRHRIDGDKGTTGPLFTNDKNARTADAVRASSFVRKRPSQSGGRMVLRPVQIDRLPL